MVVMKIIRAQPGELDMGIKNLISMIHHIEEVEISNQYHMDLLEVLSTTDTLSHIAFLKTSRISNVKITI